jgi:FkbM family methyltransferase
MTNTTVGAAGHSANGLFKRAALQIPSIRRLRDERDQLAEQLQSTRDQRDQLAEQLHSARDQLGQLTEELLAARAEIGEARQTIAANEQARLMALPLPHAKLPPPTWSAICEAARQLHCIPRGRVPNPFRLCGFTAHFLDEDNLRYLVDELFLGASYMFLAEVDSPKIIDCGSNIGLSVLFFKTLYPQARVIAFEPDPEAFEVLLRNIRHNMLRDVVAHRCALTNCEGTVDFHKPVTGGGDLRMSLDSERISGTTISVPAKRLVPFVQEPIDLLKMDVEGAEDAILTDLHRSGALRNVAQLHLEYHHHVRAHKDALADVLTLLESNGFGYQLRAWQQPWPVKGTFQDVSLYSYRKDIR